MALFQSASLLALISWSLTFHLVISEETAKPGDNVDLKCKSPVSGSIAIVEWSRPDLEPSEYVFLYRDGHFDTDYQHPSFKNRVELKDGEMKNGDLTLTLKNVTKNDTGTYECRIITDGATRSKRALISSAPISIINLKVSDLDPERPARNEQERHEPGTQGAVGRGYGLLALPIVMVVISVLSGVLFVFFRNKDLDRTSNLSSA